MRKEVRKVDETWLAERASLTRELEEQTRARERAETGNQELQERLDRDQERVRELKARAERAETRARDLRVKLKQAESRLREEESRIPEMGRRIVELEKSLEAAEGDLETGRERIHHMGRDLERIRSERDALRSELEAAPSGTVDAADLEAQLERRDELIRDLIRELEVLPTIMAEEGPVDGDAVHDMVGELERVRGENAELDRTCKGLKAELESMRERAREAEKHSTEAAALVEMVGDALEEGGPGEPTSAAGKGEVQRMLRDIQEALRRIAGDPRATTVARELGMLWVDIEERRKGL
jgi:chromosome segregation ATPase